MAEQKGKPASLQDILNYQVDSYFSNDEISLIQNTFKDPKMINLLRKALLPSVGDPSLPMEEMAGDVWLQGRDYGSIPESEIKSIVVGRQEAIKFIIGGLIKLKVIANSKPETNIEETFRRSKDSTQ